MLSEYIGDPRDGTVFSFSGNTVTINVSDKDAGIKSKFSQYYTYRVRFFIRVTWQKELTQTQPKGQVLTMADYIFTTDKR